MKELQVVENEVDLISEEVSLFKEYEEQIGSLEKKHSEFDKAAKSNIKEFLDESDSFIKRSSELQSKIYILQSTNALNDCFHIWFEGHFGTINGLRMGRLSSVPVDWNEINAAWGNIYRSSFFY